MVTATGSAFLKVGRKCCVSLCRSMTHMMERLYSAYIPFTTRFRGEEEVVEGFTEPRENTPGTGNIVVYEYPKPGEYRKLKVNSSKVLLFERIQPNVIPTPHPKQPRTTTPFFYEKTVYNKLRLKQVKKRYTLDPSNEPLGPTNEP